MVQLCCQLKDEARFELHEVVTLQGAGHADMQESRDVVRLNAVFVQHHVLSSTDTLDWQIGICFCELLARSLSVASPCYAHGLQTRDHVCLGSPV